MNRFLVLKSTLLTFVFAFGISAGAYNQQRQQGQQGQQGQQAQQGPQDGSVPCLDHGKPFALNNQQVLAWKTSTPNQFLSRGFVQGVFLSAYPDRNGHHHFKVKIGPAATDTVEVVYSKDFGSISGVQSGAKMVACGDYITSTAPAKYPASPDGAVIHWLHRSNNPRGHDSGFLWVDGRYYGL